MADLGNNYLFLTHIVSTDQRPDIVYWDDTNKTVRIIKLTIPFDTLTHEAAERKSKYAEVVTRAEDAGYNTKLITLEIGS